MLAVIRVVATLVVAMVLVAEQALAFSAAAT
jgi:hypothetical protein